MERLRHRPTAPRPDTAEAALPTGGGDPQLSMLPPPQAGLVHVMHGATTLPAPVHGMTVRESHQLLRDTLHMPDNVIATIDGRIADADERVMSGQTLEFVHASGEKGR